MLLVLALLSACTTPEATPPDWPEIEMASPQAGAAEGTLDLPIGTPMGGYSARCNCLSGQGRQDSRDSAYSTSFVESTGVHMRPTIKVVWLESGGEHLVIAKADVIYSFDGLVSAITAQLEAATGLELDGRVILATTHSHSSYGPFSQTYHFALGGDLFNKEIFERFAAEVTEVALAAQANLEPAAIGTGWAKDWDPNDAIYSDRRGVNDDLHPWPDFEGPAKKDPYLNVLRVDSAAGDPLAVVFTFGIHGISLGEDNSMISPDSTGGLEWGVEEAFDEPVVVMHLQGSGGDQSPRGRGAGSDFARIESLGELARGPIMDLWSDTPTSTDPIHLETASRHIWQHRSQIHVTRDGTVDWRYSEIVEDPHPDNQVYDIDGEIMSPIDEFNAPYGAAFCGDGSFEFPVGGLNVEAPPYDACMNVQMITELLYAFFELPPGSIPLPLPESFTTATTVSRMGPIQTLTHEGTVVERDLLTGYFPGEPLALYAEQWRRRSAAELDVEMPLLVGYAQDHEGYLLIPEDWLMGGYEPNIAIWGPLQGEHIMERTLEYADELLATTDVREDPDPSGWHAPQEYPELPLPTERPDPTPTAGTRLTTVAPERYVWLPDDFTLDLDIPDQVARGEVVQVLWEGGDPGVDLPLVTLQRDDAGTWETVTSRSGRPITSANGDFLTGWTPNPLYPASVDQTHTWWAAWQAAAHDGDRLSLPAGTYRLLVEGKKFAGTADTWPWDTTDYTVLSDEFEIVPATLTVETEGGGTGGLLVSYDAPADGWRLIDLDGSAKGQNPLRGQLTVDIDDGDAISSQTLTPVVAGTRSFLSIDVGGAVSVTVTDAHGNTGTLSF